MSSRKPKQYLVVLDVGHGSAAVLHDQGGTVVFDTGKGAHVGRHLQNVGVRCVQAMLLSHADADHIGGAVTLLLDTTLRIEEVLLNSDASKNSIVFEQLRYALAEANLKRKTQIDRRLTTSTQIERDGARIEVLHPPDAIALSGVGGKSKSGKQHNSNSMSAAIRVSCGPKSSVMLAGDIEFDCLDEWKTRKVQPSACVLVFPHHGGMPGTSNKAEAALFGFEITRMVSPEIVIFSNHRTKFNNPLDEVVAAISKAADGIRFACTQLPDRLHRNAETNDLWSLHKPTGHKGILQGSICLEFLETSVRICFGESPR
jgi:beta-lactamase superfamily II metal-dependent hydrolase